MDLTGLATFLSSQEDAFRAILPHCAPITDSIVQSLLKDHYRRLCSAANNTLPSSSPRYLESDSDVMDITPDKAQFSYLQAGRASNGRKRSTPRKMTTPNKRASHGRKADSDSNLDGSPTPNAFRRTTSAKKMTPGGASKIFGPPSRSFSVNDPANNPLFVTDTEDSSTGSLPEDPTASSRKESVSDKASKDLALSRACRKSDPRTTPQAGKGLKFFKIHDGDDFL